MTVFVLVGLFVLGFLSLSYFQARCQCPKAAPVVYPTQEEYSEPKLPVYVL